MPDAGFPVVSWPAPSCQGGYVYSTSDHGRFADQFMISWQGYYQDGNDNGSSPDTLGASDHADYCPAHLEPRADDPGPRRSLRGSDHRRELVGMVIAARAGVRARTAGHR